MELQEHTANLEIKNIEFNYRERIKHLEEENMKLKRLSSNNSIRSSSATTKNCNTSKQNSSGKQLF